MPNWLLPENIADVLPSEARKIEDLRRLMLDRFRTYGYELVMPPMLEYVESLLTGTGHDLDLRTFKLVDQLSGRTMGLRADITPQIARIDAHLLNRKGVTRLCYAGSVLFTRPRNLLATREPFQIGAEIFGHSGLEADLEIQELLLYCLQLAGLKQIRIDLCHAGVLEALIEGVPAAEAVESELFGALATKDVPQLEALTRDLPASLRDALLALTTLYGEPAETLARARKALPDLPGVRAALDDLAYLAAAQSKDGPAVLSIDLADLRGYQYHSGVMFAAYVDGIPNAIARGGRYDKVGQAFGRDRPATGFSLDLRELAAISPVEARSNAILAPADDVPGLRAKIDSLRNAGEVVIRMLPGHDQDFEEFTGDRVLVEKAGQWVVTPR
ncbi:ATP phosphoribosyltransferase regulatory subunit [Pandoraea sp. XJJ-1]|uniref:ATP phosphoribosyltransferase regulatory subunit n=1 Tax=unclassified Pandoraea TaxID=2624094 RepID=UPI000344A06E|nr:MULTISPECIES: ATP phosphoribosyltransferase regulatory subunit [unclassified Pandoraea]OJY19550.1 MAG: ATP phosphoribosyltransferase regulatory subunit [Pandoraea sp. 64-18]WAL84563.1 ATP phosphoribosyltransferase regulatory subunit [Pandoraea sp. XJJ-1]BDD94658.1 ATP phosphoribosyltransferase regulatory subunit [Pandoraea sp. NE5]